MPSRAKTPAPWTEAHQREALAYLLTLARDTVLLGEPGDLDDVEVHGHGAHEVVDEDHFVVALALYEAEPAEAVRRVRALAEGRLVRETFPAVRMHGICHRRPTVEAAKAGADEWNRAHPEPSDKATVCRVTRLRRPR